MDHPDRDHRDRPQYLWRVVFIVFLLLSQPISDEPLLPHPAPTPAPTPSVSTAPPLSHSSRNSLIKKGHPPRSKENAKLSHGYLFPLIDKKVRSSRLELSTCFLRNKNFDANQIRMTLSWEGSGELHRIVLKPDPGEDVTGCLRQVIQSWAIPSHPGMEPFVYEVMLVLGF